MPNKMQPHHSRQGCHRHLHICRLSSDCLLLNLLCICLFLGTSAWCADPNNAKQTTSSSTLHKKCNTSVESTRLKFADIEGGACPALQFRSFVAAAMGLASSTQALTTCATSPYSTIFDDVYLSRHDRASTNSLVRGLWRLTHGNTDDYSLYDNAVDFLSLRAEMGAWVRANRTVGMSPSAYEAVVRGAAAVLGLSTSLLNKPSVELPMRISTNESTSVAGTNVGASVNWTVRMQLCNRSSRCIQQMAQEAYRHHANASLRSNPSMLVSKATFARAQQYYEHTVFPSTIVRVFQLDPATTTYDFNRNLRDLLRAIQRMWDEVAREAAEETAAPSKNTNNETHSPSFIPAPYLPFLRETDLTGPRRPEARQVAHPLLDYPSPSHHTGMRLQALRRILPTVVLYQSSPDCTSCDVFDRAFDILPAVYKRMCSVSYRSIVSCSPVTLFIRTTYVRPFQLLPRMELYARLAYSRRAVLHVADLNFGREQREGGKRLEYSSAGDTAADAGAEEGIYESTPVDFDGVERDKEEEEEEYDEDEDEGTRSSLFYSLQVKYRKFNAGIENEVQPRTQFQPIRIPLRLQSNVATVEEAVVSIIGDLVGNGVIQFLFLEPTEVSQIARENEQVRQMLRDQQTQLQQEQQQRSNTSSAASENDMAPGNASTHPSSSTTTTAAGANGQAQLPPPPNPEDHPRYRKVVSLHDLITKLVAAHTRALFGDVNFVHNSDNDSAFRPAGSNSGVAGNGGGAAEVASSSTSLSLPWWASMWVFRVPRTVWGLLFSAVEHPLYFTVFVLLCMYQQWWNRSQQVSYW